MVTIRIDDAHKKMEEAFKQLKPNQVGIAIARAINRTLSKGRTSVKKNIKDLYNIPEPDFAKALTVFTANKNSLEGYIKASSKPISLSHFNPVVSFKQGGKGKQVALKRKKNKSTGKYEIIGRAKKSVSNDALGASFSVLKGQEKKLPFAFIIKGGNNKSLFARGGYDNGNFIVRHNRKNKTGSDLPISKLITTSVFSSTQNEEVKEKNMVDLTDDYEKRLVHEINFLTSKIK